MELKKVEDYLKINKHLPGMPSRCNVIANEGYNIDEVQIATVEKTEELFLYVIDLEKRIKVLEELLIKQKDY